MNQIRYKIPLDITDTKTATSAYKLLYSLCLFHSVLIGRMKYGPIGFNLAYDFNNGDLEISIEQLKSNLSESPDKIPFKVLQYLISEINYGGKVTDEQDRICIKNLVDDFCK